MAKIVVLGGGESGWGSAYLAKVKGFEVFLSDRGTLGDCYRDRLLADKIPFEEGQHTVERILDADLVIKSPGIPDSAPIVVEIKERGIEIVSEIEFAGRYDSARRISVTGSNGKTTTVSLIYEILSKAGVNVGLAGNIGASYAYQVATTKRDWYVLELSSFQLDGVSSFRSDVAVIMNITPDHLDRYDHSMDLYTASKFRITKNQREQDTFIFSGDDARIREYLSSHISDFGMRFLPFSVQKESCSMHYDGGEKMVRIFSEHGDLEIDCSRLKIQGLHNYSNVMAAAAAALEAGVSVEKIEEAVYGFEGVEHRLEYIAESGGVLYINDSKATNVDSVWYALESMSRPVVWVVGGTDKGNDYSQLDDLVKEKVRVVICMGLDNSKLMAKYGDQIEIYSTSSLEQAVEVIAKVEREGDCVLLSPACASFDLFKNYENRGELFKKAILSHIESRG